MPTNNSAEVKKLAKELYTAVYKAHRYSNFDEAAAHSSSIALVNDLIGSDVLTIAESVSLKVVAESARPKITAPPPQPVDISESMHALGRALGMTATECEILAGTDIKESGNETDQKSLDKSLSPAESQFQEIINRIVG